MPGSRIPAWLCARCKGYKRLCGLPRCPILERFRAQVHAASRVVDRRVEGDTPPSLVVGEEGYPRVPVMYQVPPGLYGDEARLHDDPLRWSEERKPLHEILELRSRLVGGVVRVKVDEPWRLYEMEASLAAVSEKPVDSEILLKHSPVPRLVFNGLTAPRGPTAPAEKLRVAGNPRVPRALDKLIFDDVLAQEAVWEAYRAGIDYYTLIRAFSAGLMGRLRNRKLVPTRWAITAVDSILASRLRALASKLPEVNEVRVYRGYYLGNRFVVILYPGPLQVRMLEIWHPSTPWVSGGKPVAIEVHERPSGEPSEMDGGFMAARIAVYEAMVRVLGRRGSAIIIREILPEYYAPVGNWHIRETLRRTLSSKPEARFESLTEALDYAVSRLEARSVARERLAGMRVRQARLDKWLRRKG